MKYKFKVGDYIKLKNNQLYCKNEEDFNKGDVYLKKGEVVKISYREKSKFGETIVYGWNNTKWTNVEENFELATKEEYQLQKMIT